MINVFQPQIWPEEISAVTEVMKSWWLAMWPKVSQFESDFSQYLGSGYCLALNSATAWLFLALEVMDIKEKEVITTAMTFVSTNHGIIQHGGIPVFTDIERDTLNISPNEIEKNITPDTKVIMVVHYGGHACDMDKIMNIAKKYNLLVIEDCAHAAWWLYKWKKLWTFWDIAVFSFHAVKNMTTGDGGMLATNNKTYYEKIKKLRWVWMSKDTYDREGEKGYSWYYDIDCLWYKFHMNDIAAAIGIEQLKKLDTLNSKRKEIAEKYNQAFQNIEWMEIPTPKDYTTSAYHNYVIKTKYRDDLNVYLAEHGISTGVHYIPSNHYDIYNKFWNPTPITQEVWSQLLTLPIYPGLSSKDQDLVIEKIVNFK